MRGLKRWALIDGNRWVIVTIITSAVFACSFFFCLLGTVGVENLSFVSSLFGGIISGLFSFVPIVISVNQLTVSQLFEPPSGLRDRIDSVHDFRTHVGELLPNEDVPPTEPSLFLATIIAGVDVRIERLRCLLVDQSDPIADSISVFTETVGEQTVTVDRQLDGSHQRLIKVLLPLMGQPYSENVNECRRLLHEHRDGLSGEAIDLIGDLQQLFVSLDVLRQYFKALYIKQELSTLSRLIAITGIGSFLVSGILLMTFAGGTTPAGDPILLELLVSLALAVATLPFAVLLSFVLRIATIAKWTAAPGAFTPRRETPAEVRLRR